MGLQLRGGLRGARVGFGRGRAEGLALFSGGVEKVHHVLELLGEPRELRILLLHLLALALRLLLRRLHLPSKRLSLLRGLLSRLAGLILRLPERRLGSVEFALELSLCGERLAGLLLVHPAQVFDLPLRLLQLRLDGRHGARQPRDATPRPEGCLRNPVDAPIRSTPTRVPRGGADASMGSRAGASDEAAGSSIPEFEVESKRGKGVRRFFGSDCRRGATTLGARRGRDERRRRRRGRG